MKAANELGYDFKFPMSDKSILLLYKATNKDDLTPLSTEQIINNCWCKVN